MIPWVKATDYSTSKPIWINLGQNASMMHFSPEGAPPFTRIWSGNTAGAAFPAPEPGKFNQHMMPFFIDVKETPEQLLMAAFGSLPGVTQ